jgi:glutathione S-transferase
MLKLPGVPLSQPFRSVAWAMLQKKSPFAVAMAVPGSKGKSGCLAEPFLSMNPLGTIPTIEEEDGFVLFESPAIMAYLADSRGWEDVYPKAPRKRAKIDSYLHWHHSGTRSLAAVAAQFLRPDLADDPVMEKGRAAAGKTLDRLSQVWLSESPFIAGSPTPSIADLLAYEEVMQLLPGAFNLLDAPLEPKLNAWVERMQGLPLHDEVHASCFALGDLRRPNDTPMAKRLGAATKIGIEALAKAQAGP